MHARGAEPGLPSPPKPQLPPHGTNSSVSPCMPLPASTLDQPTTEIQVNVSISGLPYVFMSKAEDTAVFLPSYMLCMMRNVRCLSRSRQMFMAKSQLSRTATSILSAIYVTDQMLEFVFQLQIFLLYIMQ